MDLRFPVESGKDLRLTFRRDPLSGIPDADLSEHFLCLHFDMNRASGIGIFHSVVQKIEDRFLRPFPVMPDLDLPVTIHIQPDLLLLRLGNDGRHCPPDGRPQVGFPVPDRDHACFQPGDLDHALDQEIQLFNLPFHAVQKFLRPLRHGLILEDLHTQFQIGHRCFGLVGNVGDQFLHFIFFRQAFLLFPLPDMVRPPQLFVDLPPQRVLILAIPAGHIPANLILTVLPRLLSGNDPVQALFQLICEPVDILFQKIQLPPQKRRQKQRAYRQYDQPSH